MGRPSYFGDLLRHLEETESATEFPQNKNVKAPREFLAEIGDEKNHKASPFYTAHSYPTKVPVQLIGRHLLKHSRIGDVVLDPFCGSGMTGLACKLTGRNAYISDLGTLATHIAFNHVTEADPDSLAVAVQRISSALADNDPYLFTHRGHQYRLRWLIHSAEYKCPSCRSKQKFWDVAIDPRNQNVLETPRCGECGFRLKVAASERTSFLPSYASSVSVRDNKPVELTVDASLLRRLTFELPRSFRLPVRDLPIGKDREMYIRSALHLHSVERLSDFYTSRNLFALSTLFDQIQKEKDFRTRSALMFAFTNTAWHASKLRRFNNRGGHRPLTGTLYIPQLISEGNVYEIFFRKVASLKRYYTLLRRVGSNSVIKTSNSDATNLEGVPSNSVDYVFTDPPFGSNIFYADCNFIAEAWIGVTTDTRAEAVVNRSLRPENGGKTLLQYETLLESAFAEIARVLKRGKRADVVFNNTDGETWDSVRKALERAGLSMDDTAALNKVQMSVKGYKGVSANENVATTDIVLGLINKRRKSFPSAGLPVHDHERSIRKLFKRYISSNEMTKDRRFIVSDFFSFYLRFCHQEDLDISTVSLASVRSVLERQELLELLPPEESGANPAREVA